MAHNEDMAWDLVIHNARLMDQDGLFDILVKEGVIQHINKSADNCINKHLKAKKHIDAENGLVSPSYSDTHFHLDKVLSREHFGALSPEEAFACARDVKTKFTVADVEDRACQALELAVAQGIGRMRAQVDVDFATGLVSIEGVMRAKERYKHMIDIQTVAFPQEGIVTDLKAPGLLREALSMGADLIGGLPEFERSVEDQVTHINTIFDIAEEQGVEIDMHCDYMDVPELKTLEMIAEKTVERGMQGRVYASHCNALAVYPDDEAARVIEKVREADIGISVLPAANLQMLGGKSRTPFNRGSSRIKELLSAGVNVAAGADNMFDIWYRFNRMDPVEIGYITCLSGGMRTDQDVRDAFDMVTTRGAKIMKVQEVGVQVGATADLVIHKAQNLIDIFRNLPGKRVHIKRGRSVGGVEGSTWVVGC